jgi:hypothetical protein
MGEVVDWRSFIAGTLFGKRTADPERLSPTQNTSMDVVLAKDAPLGVSSLHLITWENFPQNP